MPDVTDMNLVQEYCARQSEAAFEALVHRHVNLVYSTALRQVGNSAQAEEITQAVFIILARKAARLRPDVVLAAWLHETARYVAASFLRGEIRRRRREQEAYMQSTLQPSSDDSAWEQLAPLLDEAIGRLRTADRNVVALRFFQNKSAQEIADALNIGEAAAKKRLTRAVEKLRLDFFKRGINVPTAALSGAILAHSVQAAPATLAKSATAVAIVKGATASTSTLTLIKGALKIMAWTKAKTAIVIGLGVLLAGTTTTLLIQHQNHAKMGTDFPKSMWSTAGQADAPSALASVLLDASRGDGEKLLADLSPGMRRNFQQQFEKQIQAQGITLAQLISQMGSHWSSGVDGFHIVSQQQTAADQITLHIQPQGKNHLQTFTMKKINGEWKLHNFSDE